MMKRTPVNPWSWSLKFGYNQAELLEGHGRRLVCAGQSAMDAEGKPQHLGDMAGQVALALDNLEGVLRAGGMGLKDISRLRISAIDVRALMPHYGLIAQRLGKAGAQPPITLVGVTQLAIPELMVELEVDAEA